MDTNKTAASTIKPMKPFKIGDEKYVGYHVPGSPYGVGERVVVMSVSNNGTRKNPTYRYYVRGAWYDHDALLESSPL